MEMSATFRREIGALEDVFALVEAFFSKGQIDPEVRFPVDLAVEEIFTNFVKYNPQGQGDIAIRLSLQDNELAMALTDFDTARFDITTEAPEVDVDKPIDQRRPGGLGVHLVRKIMDRIDYQHSDRTGTITLYKRVT
jgi:serine/threonine-protein kinase RsbW